jgi:hypothetical protein
MREVWVPFRMRAALLVLETTAARAGCAMACPFGSSAEFEAAVIRGKLAAEACRRKRRWGYILAAVAVGSLLAALLTKI